MPSPRRSKPAAKVIWRKLGREQAWGQATIGENLIEVDPRLGAKRQLEVLCHEQVHLTFPQLSEPDVDRAGKDLGIGNADIVPFRDILAPARTAAVAIQAFQRLPIVKRARIVPDPAQQPARPAPAETVNHHVINRQVQIGRAHA